MREREIMREEERERVKEIACVRMCVVCVYACTFGLANQNGNDVQPKVCAFVCVCVYVCACVCASRVRALSLKLACACARSLCVHAQDTGHTHSYLLLTLLPTCPYGPSSSVRVLPPPCSLSLSVTRAHARVINPK